MPQSELLHFPSDLWLGVDLVFALALAFLFEAFEKALEFCFTEMAFEVVVIAAEPLVELLQAKAGAG